MCLDLLAVVILAGLPSCGAGGEGRLEAGLQLAINLERLETGDRPLYADPVLCQIASRRAAEVAASGSPDVDSQHLNETRREVYRLGYEPQSWSESSLMLNPGDAPLAAWQGIKPAAYEEKVGGDYEHLGVGFARHRGATGL